MAKVGSLQHNVIIIIKLGKLMATCCKSVALSSQWIFSHAGLHGNKLVDLLAKTGATLPLAYVLSPLDPVIAKIRHTRFATWRRNIFLNYLLPDLFRFLKETDPSPVTAFSCPRNYARIKRKENSLCSACGHPMQDLTHLVLDCPASEPLGTTAAFLIFGLDLGACPDCWISA